MFLRQFFVIACLGTLTGVLIKCFLILEKIENSPILQDSLAGEFPLKIDFRETIQTNCPSFLLTDIQKSYCKNNSTKACHRYCLELPHCCEIGVNPEKNHTRPPILIN